MWIVSHYNSEYKWIHDYTENFIIYDKGSKNVGYNISDIMSFIIEFYDDLPKTCVFLKDNILQRHITKKEFDKVIKNKTLTPLMTKNHKVYEPVCRYEDGLYAEINNSWYFNEHPSKYFNSYKEFANIMGLPNPEYLKFSPGACWIVPKKNILKRSKEFYQELLKFCSWSQINAESHTIERSLYEIWK